VTSSLSDRVIWCSVIPRASTCPGYCAHDLHLNNQCPVTPRFAPPICLIVKCLKRTTTVIEAKRISIDYRLFRLKVSPFKLGNEK
jgi:hypothetical protein